MWKGELYNPHLYSSVSFTLYFNRCRWGGSAVIIHSHTRVDASVLRHQITDLQHYITRFPTRAQHRERENQITKRSVFHITGWILALSSLQNCLFSTTLEGFLFKDLLSSQDLYSKVKQSLILKEFTAIVHNRISTFHYRTDCIQSTSVSWLWLIVD